MQTKESTSSLREAEGLPLGSRAGILDPRMRRTKIVATIGPASRDPRVLERLLEAGVDVARLNFSHGTYEDHLAVIRAAREIAARLERPLALLQDLSGPKIRTGRMKGDQPIQLREGATVRITTDLSVEGTAELIATTYEPLPRDLRPGDRVLLDDGNLELKVLGVTGGLVECEVVDGGLLRSHKGMNLPGAKLSAPALTEKDRKDLAFGIESGVDYVALSFVRNPADVREAKALIRSLGGAQPLIAKIEKREAIDALDAVLEATDGVMVARGDLGVEVSTESVPTLQKLIIKKANGLGKVVITATQMLESMIENPRPTRAEASDVANAILDGTDGVMLSAESRRAATRSRPWKPWLASRTSRRSTTASASPAGSRGPSAPTWPAAWPGWPPPWPRSWAASSSSASPSREPPPAWSPPSAPGRPSPPSPTTRAFTGSSPSGGVSSLSGRSSRRRPTRW